MWEWLKSIFGGKKEETREPLYCSIHGSRLVVTAKILTYDVYTGDPEKMVRTTSCIDCSKEAISNG